MMRCERQRVTLTHAGCARLWESVQKADTRPKPWEARAHCVGCPVGARNAGKPHEAAFVPAVVLQALCPRCRRISDRMVGKALCISCYNRDREAKLGRNAKGGRPRLCDQLRTVVLSVVAGDEVAALHQAAVVDVAEAILRAARQARHPMAFGRLGTNE